MPDDLHDALHEEKERTGKSLNQTVIDLLRQRLGFGDTYSNGLRRLAGRWSEQEFLEFEEAVRPFEQIDPEVWE